MKNLSLISILFVPLFFVVNFADATDVSVGGQFQNTSPDEGTSVVYELDVQNIGPDESRIDLDFTVGNHLTYASHIINGGCASGGSGASTTANGFSVSQINAGLGCSFKVLVTFNISANSCSENTNVSVSANSTVDIAQCSLELNCTNKSGLTCLVDELNEFGQCTGTFCTATATSAYDSCYLPTQGACNGDAQCLEDLQETCYDEALAAAHVCLQGATIPTTPSVTTATDTASLTINDCIPISVCGDGLPGAGEQCDDGNNVDGDGCSASCQIEVPVCGDGKINQSSEQCDDGNTVSGDKCSATCEIEQTTPAPICGDGQVNQSSEQCDDGNTVNDDKCSNTCQNVVEPTPMCGDGTVDAGETCDDGNTVNGDGCSATCAVENDQVDPSGELEQAETCSVDDYADIEGEVWIDENNNGKRDKGEPGIEDVTVYLTDLDGNEIDSDETNDDGEFEFKNYAPGEYYVDLQESDKDLDGLKLKVEEDTTLNGKDRFELECDEDYDDATFGYVSEEKKVHTERPRTLAKTGGPQTAWEHVMALIAAIF